MGVAAAPLAGIGLLASAGSSIIGGIGTSQADQYQAARLERAAEYGKVAATEVSAQGLEKLNVTLGNIDAVRAVGNVDPSSPTTEAIRSRTTYLAERDTNIKVGNILGQVAQNEADAAYMRSASAFALTNGIIGAGATLGKGIGTTNFGTFGFPGGGGG